MVEAGINPWRRVLERRAEFDRLRAFGTSPKDAARQVGVHIRTAIDWDLGMRRSNGLRIDSDDRAMGYNKDVITYDNRRARLATILPAHLRGSLTWDQCSKKNTNGLLCQYFTKSTDLSVYWLEDLEDVAQELNARPPHTLSWDIPAEWFHDLMIPT